jgi:hypothetical protein
MNFSLINEHPTHPMISEVLNVMQGWANRLDLDPVIKSYNKADIENVLQQDLKDFSSVLTEMNSTSAEIILEIRFTMYL